MKYYDNLDVTGEICTGGKIVATKEYVDGLISGESGGLKGCIEALNTKLSEHTADFVKHEEDFATFKGENDAKIAELVAKDEELTGKDQELTDKLGDVDKHVQSEANPHKTSLKQVIETDGVAEFAWNNQESPRVKVKIGDYNNYGNDYTLQIDPEILKIASGPAGIEFSDGKINATGVIYGIKETDKTKTEALTTVSLVNDIVDAGIKTIADNVEEVKKELDEKINNVVSSKVKVVVLKVGEDLPAQGDSLTIYFKPVKTDGKDLYEEYIWLVSEQSQTGRYELLGNTEIALANYVTTETLGVETGKLSGCIDALETKVSKDIEESKSYSIAQAKVYTDSIGCSITDALKGCVSELKAYVDEEVKKENTAAKEYTNGCISASEEKLTKNITDAYTHYVEDSITAATTSITDAYTSYVCTSIAPLKTSVEDLCNAGCVASEAIGELKVASNDHRSRIDELYKTLVTGENSVIVDIANLKNKDEKHDELIAANTANIEESFKKIETNKDNIEVNAKNITSNTNRITSLEEAVAKFSPVEVLRENATNATEIVVDGKDYKVVQVYQIVNKTRKLVVADITIDEANNKTIIGFATALSGTFDICLVK